MRQGFTLLQLLVVLSMISILSAIGLPRLNATLNRIAVTSAASDIAGAFSMARHVAIGKSAYVAVHVDSGRKSVAVAIKSDTILLRLVGLVHGVSVRSNRDSMTYDPLGHGFGAANHSIVVSRGGVADTVVISRLGRVRFRE